jgi:hypothetical protein
MAHPTAFKYEIGFLNISQETRTATATCKNAKTGFWLISKMQK